VDPNTQGQEERGCSLGLEKKQNIFVRPSHLHFFKSLRTTWCVCLHEETDKAINTGKPFHQQMREFQADTTEMTQLKSDSVLPLSIKSQMCMEKI